MVLEVLDIGMTRHPAQAGLHVCESYLQAVTWTVLHGGISLQTAGLQHATTLLRTRPLQQLPFAGLASAVLISLKTWTEASGVEASKLQAWSDAVISCLWQLLQAAQAALQVTSVVGSIADALAAAIRASTTQMQLQTRLCSVLAAVAKLWPPTLSCLPSLVPLACSNAALGLQLVRCLSVLAVDADAARELDAAMRQQPSPQARLFSHFIVLPCSCITPR